MGYVPEPGPIWAVIQPTNHSPLLRETQFQGSAGDGRELDLWGPEMNTQGCERRSLPHWGGGGTAGSPW